MTLGEFSPLWDSEEIWDNVRETYSSTENTIKPFEIEANTHDLCQGHLTLTQYFNNIAGL